MLISQSACKLALYSKHILFIIDLEIKMFFLFLHIRDKTIPLEVKLVHLWHTFYLVVFLIYFFKCVLIFGGARSSSLLLGVVQFRQRGMLNSSGARASRCSGFSCCGAQAPRHAGFSSCGSWAQQLHLPGSRAQAQYLGRTGLVAFRHEGSYRIRDWIHVSYIGRRIFSFTTEPSWEPDTLFNQLKQEWETGFSVCIFWKLV